MTPQQRWPEGPDQVSAELRRALDEATMRGPDDMTLRRGWAAVAMPPEPPRTRRGFWFTGFVASTAALAVVAGVSLWPRAAERWQNRGRSVVHGDSIVATASRHVTLEGGVDAVIGRSGVMRIDQGAARVEAGEVRFSVPHRAPGHPFVVRAEGYRVVVVGTRFGVSVEDAAVFVDVDEGVVEVWETATQRRLARLTPGDSWRSPERAAANEAPASAAAAPSPATAPQATPAATAAAAPAFVVPSLIAHGHRFHRRPGGRTVALSSPGEAAGETDRGEDQAKDPAVAARAALSAGDAPRALQLYRSLAQGTGPSAENAAYEVGKVLNEKMGQPTGAVAAWRHYRATYPDGILRVEADVSIIETLARSGDADGALIEANEFLRRRPDSERRAEIARLAGDLYRARGECRRAVPMYQLASGASRPRDAVEAAAFHRADCLARLGDSSAPEAARSYLHNYPTGRFRTEAETLAAGTSRP